jgi:hypothetical protein
MMTMLKYLDFYRDSSPFAGGTNEEGFARATNEEGFARGTNEERKGTNEGTGRINYVKFLLVRA